MSQYASVCDDFYVSSRLFLKLDMNLQRETILHFFDRIRKEYPGLRKLRRRDDAQAGSASQQAGFANDCLVLEEEAPERGPRRWIRLDRTSLRFGHFGPPDTDDVRRFGELILTQAPYHLSFSTALISSTTATTIRSWPRRCWVSTRRPASCSATRRRT